MPRGTQPRAHTTTLTRLLRDPSALLALHAQLALLVRLLCGLLGGASEDAGSTDPYPVAQGGLASNQSSAAALTTAPGECAARPLCAFADLQTVRAVCSFVLLRTLLRGPWVAVSDFIDLLTPFVLALALRDALGLGP